MENDYLWMLCSLSFSGSMNLSVSWIRKSTEDVLHNTVGNINQSVIVIQVNCSDNNETFMFKATFRQENNSNSTVISWNYTVKVLCEWAVS